MILKRFFVSLISTLKCLSKTIVIKNKSFGRHQLNQMENSLPFVVNDQLLVMINRSTNQQVWSGLVSEMLKTTEKLKY